MKERTGILQRTGKLDSSENLGNYGAQCNPENCRELRQPVELESNPCREPQRGRIQRTQQGEESREHEEDEKDLQKYRRIKWTREQGEVIHKVATRENPENHREQEESRALEITVRNYGTQ